MILLLDIAIRAQEIAVFAEAKRLFTGTTNKNVMAIAV